MVGYRVLVDVAYPILVGRPFYYLGFQSAPTWRGLLVSWLFLLALLPLVVRVLRTETVSAQITSLLVLVSLVPTTTLIAFDPRYSAWYITLIFVYWLLFLLACVFLPAIRPFRRPLRSEVPHLLTVGVLSATVLFVSWRYTDFRLHFGVFDVYELRLEAREYQVATIVGYLTTIADNTLPILLAYYLRRRWVLVSVALAAVILFNFGISATKQVLFLLVFAVASVGIRDNTRMNKKALIALAVIVSLGIIEFLGLGSLIVGSLAIHRIFFIPAHLHWTTYQFFETRELLLLTQSALRFFFESPYRENVQFLLGEFSTGDITGRANNGLFSDGYMNFGAVSVLFYPVLCVFLLKLVEGSAKDLPTSVHFMIIVACTFVFQGVPIPTALLTSGVGTLILLLSTLPRPKSRAPVADAKPT